MSSKTSTVYVKHGQFMEDSVIIPKVSNRVLHTFIFEIFISDSFSVGEDSLCSSMYEFMVGKCFGVF